MPSNRAVLHDITELNLDPRVAHVATGANGRLRTARSISSLDEIEVAPPTEPVTSTKTETTSNKEKPVEPEATTSAASTTVEPAKPVTDEATAEKASKKQRSKKNESTTE